MESARYADIRPKKGGNYDSSAKRTDSRSSRQGDSFDHKKARDISRPHHSRSRSRSRSPKRDRSSKKDEKRDRHSPYSKSVSKGGKRRSPSPIHKKKSRKHSPSIPKSLSPPRSPSPPASPSPPRSPSPENEQGSPASSFASSRSDASTDGGRRQKSRTSSRQKRSRGEGVVKRFDKRHKRGGDFYDEMLEFEEEDANGTAYEDEKYPDIGEIYEAAVAAIKPFGFFCLLLGLRHKCYGLVHISEMKRDGYVTNVDEVVQMGQHVFVKVISNQPKVALSLKDVDQETGEDIDVKRTLKLMEDPEFLDKEKNVRQNRGNGLVVSGLQFTTESEYRDLIANLLVNEMNLPATPEQIGYCQPVQGIEFRKKGATTQLVKIRFYEDESVPYNRDDVLSRYMTLRNTNLWRHKEIVLNPELRTMGPPRPRIRESLLAPSDFLPPAPIEEFPEEQPSGLMEGAVEGEQNGGANGEEPGGFVPLPQIGARVGGSDEEDEDDLKLPKRPVPSAASASKPFSQEMMSQIVTRVRASLNTILKPTTRFELPRTFSSMPAPPPPVPPPSSGGGGASATLPGPAPMVGKLPVFHSAPPPPVNLPSINVNVPPPKMTINISGMPQKTTSSTGATTTTLQQQINASSAMEMKGGAPATVQYPSLQQYQQPQPPPFSTGALPSHLAALQQQLQQQLQQHARFGTPPPMIRPPGVTMPGSGGMQQQQAQQNQPYPFNIPPLLSASGGQQQRSLGPYTNSAQAQQHLQQLLSALPSSLFAPTRSDSVAGIPPLLGSLPQQQQQQQPQNPYLQGAPHMGQSWQHNPYALGASSLGGMSSPSSSDSSTLQPSKITTSGVTKSSSSTSTKEKEKGTSESSGPAPAEITQLLSLAKKLGFNIKTSTAE